MLTPNGADTPLAAACRRRHGLDRLHRGDRGARTVDRVGGRLTRDRPPDRDHRRHPGRDLRRLPALPRGALVREAMLTPRPAPPKGLPVAAAALVVAFAFPVFLL